MNFMIKQLTSLDTMLCFSWVDFKTGKKMFFSLSVKNTQNGVGRFNCEAALAGFSTVLPWPSSACIRIKSLSKYKAFPV